MLSNILVYGILNGAVYALLAVGFALIFGVARIINMAHTAYFMVAAYCVFFFTSRLGFNPILSIVLSIIAVCVMGIVIYYFFMDPIREHETAVLIVTVAVAMVLQEMMILIFGGHYFSVSSVVSGYTELFGMRITYQYLLTIGVVIFCLVAIWLILKKTRLGLAIRAAAQDREVANLMGMPVARVAAYTMALAVALASVAGVMVAPLYTLEPHMWLNPLVLILAIVILGGLGSIKGSFIGALILAFIEVTTVFMMPGGSYLKVPIALGIMLLILLVRPEGLFGVYFEGER